MAAARATCYIGETKRIRSRNCPCLRWRAVRRSAAPRSSTRTTVHRLPPRAAEEDECSPNSDELLKYIKDEGVEMVDVRFCDLPGVMQHFTVPVSSFDQSVFDDGLNFDGSSIRGFQAIHESDMSLFPDPTTAYLDPFRTAKTLVVNFFIHDPLTGEAYSRDPRNIARKAKAYLASTGIGDTAYFAPEAEFYVFDNVRFETKAERRLLRHRLRGRRLEHRLARGQQPRLQGAVQGRLLPGRAVRPLRRAARRDGHRAGELRPQRRARPPRGRHRRPGRDQLQASTSCSRPPTT